MRAESDDVSVSYNRPAIAKLAASIARGSAAVLVGAGISRRLGYPDWNGLLEQMRNVIQERRPKGAAPLALPKGGDALWRAEKYRALMGDAYGPFIKNLFRAGEDAKLSTDACLRHLCALPFAFYLTTNYDRSLERAHALLHGRTLDSFHFEDEAKITRFLLGLHGGARQDVCVHVHGLHDELRGLVLTESDYQRRYLQTDEHRFKLLLMFASHSIVFVGFSLADLDLLNVPREMKAKLRFEDTRHFAVLPFEDDKEAELAEHRDSLASKYAIEPILYKVTKDAEGRRNFEGLVQVLEEIRAAVERAQTGAPSPAGGRATELPVKGVDTLSATREPITTKDTGTLSATLGRITTKDAGTRGFGTPAESTRGGPARRGVPGGRVEAVVAYEPGPVRFPDDPQKGRWGERAERDGLRLSAVVRERAGAAGWFEAELRVDARTAAAQGDVTFHLHDTFDPPHVTQPLTRGRAALTVVVWGAFTVGALVRLDGRQIPLELDLTTLEEAPPRFRESG